MTQTQHFVVISRQRRNIKLANSKHIWAIEQTKHASMRQLVIFSERLKNRKGTRSKFGERLIICFAQSIPVAPEQLPMSVFTR